MMQIAYLVGLSDPTKGTTLAPPFSQLARSTDTTSASNNSTTLHVSQRKTTDVNPSNSTSGISDTAWVLVDVGCRTRDAVEQPMDFVVEPRVDKAAACMKALEAYASESIGMSGAQLGGCTDESALRTEMAGKGRRFQGASGHEYYVNDGSCCGYGAQKLVAYCAG